MTPTAPVRSPRQGEHRTLSKFAGRVGKTNCKLSAMAIGDDQATEATDRSDTPSRPGIAKRFDVSDKLPAAAAKMGSSLARLRVRLQCAQVLEAQLRAEAKGAAGAYGGYQFQCCRRVTDVPALSAAAASPPPTPTCPDAAL